MSEKESKRAWFAPTDLASWEMSLMRLLFVLIVFAIIPTASSLTSQPNPVGIAHFVDLTFLAKPGVLSGIRIALIPVAICYVIGFLPVATRLLLLLGTVLPGTLDNSQGSTQHSLQVISLILLAQLSCAIWFKLRKGHRKEARLWDVFASQQAIVAAYVVTAITKISVSGVGWIIHSKNFPIQMQKNLQMAYYNTLEYPTKQPGFWASWPDKVQTLFLESPNLCRVMLTSGLALELFAILALLGKRWAAAYGALLILFHLLVRAMTGLNFRFHMSVLFIFLVLPFLLGFVSKIIEKRKLAA